LVLLGKNAVLIVGLPFSDTQQEICARGCDGRSKSKVPSYFDDVICAGLLTIGITTGPGKIGNRLLERPQQGMLIGNLQCIYNSGIVLHLWSNSRKYKLVKGRRKSIN
jgi:hypothetical protein